MKRVAWVRLKLVVGPTDDVDIHDGSWVMGHAWTPVELVVGPTNDVDIYGWVMGHGSWVMGHAWTPPPHQYPLYLNFKPIFYASSIFKL